MYDLKINYTFMPHNRDHNKPTIGNFGVVLSLHRKRITMLPGTVQADIIELKVTRNQLTKRIRLIRSVILNTFER